MKRAQIRYVASGWQEPLNRKIALARVVVESQHGSAGWQIRQFLRNRSQRRPRRNTDQDTFFGGAAAGLFTRGLGIDQDHTVEQTGIQILGDEAGAQSLDGVWAGGAAGNDGRAGRLNGIHLELGELGL